MAYNVDQKAFIDGQFNQQPHYGIIGAVGSTAENLFNPDYAIDGKISYDPIWEAVAPLYSQYMKPKYIEGDKENSTMFVISEDFGQTYQESPTIMGLIGLKDNANSFEEAPLLIGQI